MITMMTLITMVSTIRRIDVGNFQSPGSQRRPPPVQSVEADPGSQGLLHRRQGKALNLSKSLRNMYILPLLTPINGHPCLKNVICQLNSLGANLHDRDDQPKHVLVRAHVEHVALRGPGKGVGRRQGRQGTGASIKKFGEILLTKLMSTHIQGGGNSLDYEDDLLGGSLGDLESEHGQRTEDGVLSPEDSDLAQLR